MRLLGKFLPVAMGACLVGAASIPSNAGALSGPSAAATSSSGVLDFSAVTQVGKVPGVSLATALMVAQHFDIITGHSNQFTPYLKAMKAANPNLVVLSYLNADYQSSATGLPASMYLYDAHHNKIHTLQYQLYLMNPTDPGWVANRISACSQLIASTGYDGCDLDNLGTGALQIGFVNALPVDPATHQVFTNAQWLSATDHLATGVKQKVGSHVIIGNGLGSGQRFYDTGSQVLLNGEDGAICEGFIRNGGDPIGLVPSETDWKKNVDMLVLAGTKGKRIITITKTWTRASAAQIASMHEFTLASFLLGNDGRSSYSFFATPTSVATTPDPWSGFPVGPPVGTYAQVNGVYQRSFTTGKVLVNPTKSPVTVALGGTYFDINGRSMSSAALAPESGLILRK